MSAMAVCASHSPLMGTVDGGRGGLVFLAGVDRARELIADFEPDLVVFFGPDHSRALTDLVPTFTVVSSAVGYGDWGTPEDSYWVDAVAARDLAAELVAHDFDVALGNQMRLDHGFGQTFVQLFGDLGCIPSLPIVVNCARPPLPSVARVIDFGRAVGAHVRAHSRRTLFVGSGGLSHQPPSMTTSVIGLSEAERERVARSTVGDAARFVNPEWDRRFLDRLTGPDWAELGTMTDYEIASAGLGTHEVRTWLGAWAASGARSGQYIYAPVPEWITGMGLATSAALR